jgi:hypothetical protein
MARSGDDDDDRDGRSGWENHEGRALLVVDEQMLVLLEWAAHHPKPWHDIGNDPATVRAACSRKRFLSHGYSVLPARA